MTPPPAASRRPRIACLATQGGHAGGAAIAMERLAAGLRGAGADVEVVTRADVRWRPEVRQLDRRIRRRIRHGRTPLSNTLFTADWPAWDIAGHPAVASADLVNLHWVAGFINADGIRRIAASGRPVAWTLHDMRAFTGGCHYASSCAGFMADCQACPQLRPPLGDLAGRSLVRTRRRLHGVPLTFITPSRWLADELRRSSLFDPAAHAVRVIPNGLDLDRYRPGDRAAARLRLGLPAAGLGILLGSVSLEERRKGGDAAVETIGRMAASLSGRGASHPQPFVVTYGGGELTIPGVACRHLGPVDEAGVLEAIQACDVHLTMAREDNLPNTVMEALAGGLPVVAARAGGLPEMIDDGITGWLVPVDDTSAAAGVLARLAEHPEQASRAGRSGRLRAEAEWAASLQAGRYLDLAVELAEGRQSPQSPSPRPAFTADAVTVLTPAAAAVAHPAASLRGSLRRVRRLVSFTPRKAA